MKSAEIRSRFLQYFEDRGHVRRPSGPLVPPEDPTLLFTNAGMVQFKKVFLGEEVVPYGRAVTSQKCVRAGGKHNDLEQVGVTARHHTFFEMLGNFSFGDYFKTEAIQFGWEFLTRELGIDPERLFATVHHSDDEAHRIWTDDVGLDERRVFRLGDRDNFWQMADTGPCGPCSEIHYDLRTQDERRLPSQEEFMALGDAGAMLELWNLVFMQFDRSADGTLNPLPAPSIDTGAGLERLAAVLQDADSNYHTDLFLPLLERVAAGVGRPYQAEGPAGVGYRVLADHARAVAFLLADGVFPANEGRGYVLRRILRRGVRHAWLLGVRTPILADVVSEVVAVMGGIFPELRESESLLVQTTRREEERFLDTIEGGMSRFDELAPVTGDRDAPRHISGEDAFRLYDTYGFPLDLTELMAQERGYDVDAVGFQAALDAQRTRSRADRAEAGASSAGRDGPGRESWETPETGEEQAWVGWDAIEVETVVIGWQREGDRVGLILRENPFYLEAGGQVADVGVVEGDGWHVEVDDVQRIEGWTAVVGTGHGGVPASPNGLTTVRARVDSEHRLNTERHHTATHLLHAALRTVLGEHVMQRGSRVEPDRLRFDFSHPDPVGPDALAAVEEWVNEAIWADHPVQWEILAREEAIARGAMALFGERYGDEVRIVDIPGVSLELCGGNHLRHTGAAGLFTVIREGGVAAGVRRIEAVTGPMAFHRLKQSEVELEAVARTMKTSREALPQRVEDLLRERDQLERLLGEARQVSGAGETVVHDAEVPAGNGVVARYRGLRMKVRGPDDARAFGDAFRERESHGVAALVTESLDGKWGVFVFVTDDLIGRGVAAGALVQKIASAAGGRGGGRPHMAQGGIEDPDRADEALRLGEAALRDALSADED